MSKSIRNPQTDHVPYRPCAPTTPLTLPIPIGRFRYNLWCIGWTSADLSRRLRLDESSTRRMARGEKRVPNNVAIFTEQLAAIHRALWEPVGWAPSGQSSLKFMQVPEDCDPDDTEVAPDFPPLYAPEDHPDAPGSTTLRPPYQKPFDNETR